MPYVLLILGALIGLYGLYRFFIQASPPQIIAFAAASAFVVVGTAIFFMAITGRLAPAIGLFVAMLPFIAAFWKKNRDTIQNAAKFPKQEQASGPMTREEALKVLGLSKGATKDQIEEAYKKLIKKLHPDQEGSDWLATKLNQARDILLG